MPALILIVAAWGRLTGAGDAGAFIAALIAGFIIGDVQWLLLQPTPGRAGPWLLSSGLGCLVAVGVLSVAATRLWIPPLPQLILSTARAGGTYRVATSIGLCFNSR